MEKLRKVMAEKKISNRTLAKRTKMNENYISVLKNNDENPNPTLKTLKIIAKELGVEVRDIV